MSYIISRQYKPIHAGHIFSASVYFDLKDSHCLFTSFGYLSNYDFQSISPINSLNLL